MVAYYSCSLSRPERNYCVTRRELLAVVLAVRHFRPYLLGTKFTLRTDHASLTWMLNFRQPEGQVARWLEILQEYDFEVQHRPGRQHANADALSRRPCLADECRYCGRQEERGLGPSSAAVEPSDSGGDGEPFTTEQLKQQQANDPVLVKVRGWLEARTRPDWQAVSSQGPEIKSFHSQWGSLELHNGMIYRRVAGTWGGNRPSATPSPPHSAVGGSFVGCMGQLEPAISGTPRQLRRLRAAVLLAGVSAGCRAARALLRCLHSTERTKPTLSRAVAAVPSRGAHGEDRSGHLGSVPRHRGWQPFCPSRYGLLHEVARGICGAGSECFHDGTATSG